jgi:hypothetical protein
MTDQATKTPPPAFPLLSALDKQPSTTPSKCAFSRAACTLSLSLSCLLTICTRGELLDEDMMVTGNRMIHTGILALMHALFDPDVDLVLGRQGAEQSNPER